jgi:hypothetical protein
VTKDCRLRIADFGLARERPTGHGTDPDEEIDGMEKHLYRLFQHNFIAYLQRRLLAMSLPLFVFLRFTLFSFTTV